MLVQFLIVVYFFFPETRGYKLEDISELFENKGIFLGRAKIQGNTNEAARQAAEEKGMKDADVELVEDVVLRTKTEPNS